MSSARLVTLSACETGITDVMIGSADEFVGLPAGFMLCGCSMRNKQSLVGFGYLYNHTAAFLLKSCCQRNGYLALQEAQLWVRDLTYSQVAGYIEKCYCSREWKGESKEFIEQYRERYLEIAKKSPEEKPFHHPYYWTAFTVNGA